MSARRRAGGAVMSSIAFDASVPWMRATSRRSSATLVLAPLSRGFPRSVLERPERLDDHSRYRVKDALVMPERLHSNGYFISPTG
jgi:hypothetical protein